MLRGYTLARYHCAAVCVQLREGADMAGTTLTVGAAARLLDMDPSAVRRAILQDRLPATKFGRDWSLRPEDVAAYQRRPQRGGRPRRTIATKRDTGDLPPTGGEPERARP